MQLRTIIALGACLASVAAWAQEAPAANIDDLFDAPAETTATEARTIDNPEAVVLESKGLVWGGELGADATMEIPYGALPPATLSDWGKAEDRAGFDLGATLFFDARPDRNYRVYGSFRTAYPFASGLGSVVELFADFNWREALFIRFGKQTMGWGLSRFYQVADPLSVGVKDPQDPTKELEGPVGLKLSLPLGPHTLYAYAVAKDSYLKDSAIAWGATSPSLPGIEDLGYGLKGDFLLSLPKNPILSDAELNAGLYYQRRLAPKAVFGLSTGVGQVQLFSDQVLSLGRDGYRLDPGLEGIPTPAGTMLVHGASADDTTLYYSATAGAMYVNKDLHLTVYGEYFYNGAGSDDPGYTKELGERYAAELIRDDGGPRRVAQSDLFAYNGRHNTGFSASLSELFGSDKLSFGLFWQSNWSDRSGMVVPTLAYAPWKRLSLSLGSRFVYGADQSEFVLKNSSFSGGQATAVRFAPFVKLYLGAGKF